MSQTTSTSGGSVNAKEKGTTKPNIFQRLIIFIREVIAELRNTTRPTREKWWVLVLVVLIFVGSVMVYVGVLDVIFAKLIALIFG